MSRVKKRSIITKQCIGLSAGVVQCLEDMLRLISQCLKAEIKLVLQVFFFFFLPV